jgi:uncharacterized protein
MMKRRTALAILGVFSAMLAGCASTQTNFYTLSPTAKSMAAAASYSIAVGPVSVPAIVDRPQIVVRVGTNQVAIDEFNRWASPLKNEIARVVAENLASMLGASNVTLFPQSTAVVASYRVVIDVLRFESAPGEAATLDAVWVTRSTKGDRALTGRTTLHESPQDAGYAALVAAHSSLLVQLSSEIAAAIRTMEEAEK